MRQGQSVTAGSPRPGLAGAPARSDGTVEDHLIIEDGWVFREHHGKYVECICRSDELPLFGQNIRRAARR